MCFLYIPDAQIDRKMTRKTFEIKEKCKNVFVHIFYYFL